jgi:hypothetical protein
MLLAALITLGTLVFHGSIVCLLVIVVVLCTGIDQLYRDVAVVLEPPVRFCTNASRTARRACTATTDRPSSGRPVSG